MTLIPTRLLVLQRLTELLEGPLTVEGVEVDMTGAVFRGRNLVGEERKAGPVLSILEAPRPDVASYAGENAFMSSDRWTLLITGMTGDDKINPGDPAYYLCAAVQQRLHRIVAVKGTSGTPLYPEHYMLGKSITGLEVAPPVVRPPDDKVSSSAFFFLPVRVGIAVNYGEPYTSVP